MDITPADEMPVQSVIKLGHVYRLFWFEIDMFPALCYILTGLEIPEQGDGDEPEEGAEAVKKKKKKKKKKGGGGGGGGGGGAADPEFLHPMTNPTGKD